MDCTNHFRCNSSGEYISHTSVCDGNVDCKDMSDECGDSCSKDKNLIENSSLLVISIVMGVLAICLNFFNIVESFLCSTKITTLGGMMNKLMVNLISLGDLLMGIYLVLTAAAHFQHSDTYCFQRFQWISSSSCAILGVISTIGSQLSLFAMTTLSVFRVLSLGQMVQPSPSSKKSKFIMFMSVFGNLLLSGLIGTVPLFAPFEDYFVNGLYYHESPLFMASVNKAKHGDILGAYHGISNFPKDLSWNRIRHYVAQMFSSDYGGKFVEQLKII